MGPDTERRRHPRAPLDANVLLECDDAEPVELVALDVSDESLRGTASRPLAVGTRVWLDLVLPPGFVPAAANRFRIRAEVVRCAPSGGGHDTHELAVHFSELGVSEEETLGRYVRRRNLLNGR